MRSIYFAAPSLIAGSLAATASAQTPQGSRLEENRTRDRQSAQLQPLGLTAGPLRVLPRIELGVLYDDNVYATEANEADDTVFRIEPAVGVTANTNGYRLNAAASLEHLEFTDFDDESRTNFRFESTAGTEVVRDLDTEVHLNYAIDHEDRGDPNSLSSNVEPVKFKELDVGGEIQRQARRLLLGLEAGFRTIDFSNVPRVDGTIENNADRDRDRYNLGARAGYELSPGYSIILRTNFEKIDFKQALDDFGFDRDSRTWRLTGGLTFELSRLLTGDLFAGYVDRDYDDARYRSIRKPIFGAGLTWSPTELTTVRLTASRTIEETIFGGYQAFIFSSLGARVEHELTRQIILNAGLRYGKFDFVRNRVSTAPSRDDDNYGVTVGARYAFSRRLYARLGYDWSRRNSSDFGSEFNRNRIQVALGFQF